jgi:spore maturation protein CgeB
MVITEDSEDTPAGDYYTAKGLGKELERLGFTVEYIPLLPEQEWYNVPNDTDVLIVLLDNYNLKRVGNNDIIKIAWIRNWVEKWVRHEWFSDYDVILTSSEEARSMVKERTGREAEILMIGADTDIFTPLESREEYQSDIVFTGNYWGAHRDIIDLLQVEPKWDFHIYGNNWDQIDRLKKYWRGFVNYKELPFIYNSAKIVLDDHNHVTKPYGMINSRVFEAMACGSCVVTNAVKDIFTIFPEEAISVYRNSDDLTRIITELLSDDDRRGRIGQKAREVILQRHTYKKRAEQFREILLRTVGHETLS